jgi:3-oxoacyl-(acyl-carrier-protein) synthase
MSRAIIAGAAAALGESLEGEIGRLPPAVQTRVLRTERVTQLALVAAGGALAEAGLTVTDGPLQPRAGVALGTAFGCFLTNAAYQRRLAGAGPRVASPRLFAATVSNAAAGEVSIAYRLGGPAVTLTAGAAAGLLAIGHAADLVAAGRAEAMVAGGMDARGPALERWLADGGLPSGEAPACEAAAAVVLEPPRTARGPRRGAVLGHGAGFTPPGDSDDAGLSAAVGQALADAGLRPGDIALVAVEATVGTAETVQRALRAALGAMPTPRLRTPRERGESFAAGGPLALLAALAEAPPGRPFLVVHLCASGHVAALVAARAGDA